MLLSATLLLLLRAAGGAVSGGEATRFGRFRGHGGPGGGQVDGHGGLLVPVGVALLKKATGLGLGYLLLSLDRDALFSAQAYDGMADSSTVRDKKNKSSSAAPLSLGTPSSPISRQNSTWCQEQENTPRGLWGIRLHPRLWAPPTLGFPPLPQLKLAPIRSVGKGVDFPDISRTKQDDEAVQRAREAHGRRVALATEHNERLCAGLQRGDHLRTQGAFGFRSMAHHAIYIGDGEIVHFTGGAGTDTSLDAKRRAMVTREKLTVMLAVANQHGSLLEVVDHGRSDPSKASKVVHRALSRVGEKGYNVVRSNCEHFAQWCVTGETRSLQVARALARPVDFLADLLGDLLDTMHDPVRGKGLRSATASVYASLAMLAVHLVLF